MSVIREELASRYFEQDIIRFGDFEISAHQQNPDLPLSPIYMHLPKPGEPGFEESETVVTLSGKLLFELAEEAGVHNRPLSAIPSGGTRLGRSAVAYGGSRSGPFREFKKQATNSGYLFVPANEPPVAGELLATFEDHTSGAITALRFARMLSANHHAFMTHLINVCDREQGGRKTLAASGITMISIFTISELLEIGVAENHITQDTRQQVLDYIRANQIPPPDWLDAKAGNVDTGKSLA